MAKIIDITEKLNFEEKPKIIIKGEKYEINDSATAMLKVIPLLEDENGVTASVINKTYETIFPEKEREKIDKLNLNFEDFTTLVMTAVQTIAGHSDNEGETPTPATT